ncbi:MAG TPA: hypothetical protein ENJ44_06055 [Oceanospirillales bacterium]|nr:hypothetical protein [Oceanospirillales bacterium]
MWWLIEKLHGIADIEGAYSATGWGGPYITVIPKRKLVIAHKTKLSFLTLWGLTAGGVSDSQYWQIINKLLMT